MFHFSTFIRVWELLNEKKKEEKVLKHSISFGSILFQVCEM